MRRGACIADGDWLRESSKGGGGAHRPLFLFLGFPPIALPLPHEHVALLPLHLAAGRRRRKAVVVEHVDDAGTQVGVLELVGQKLDAIKGPTLGEVHLDLQVAA